MSPIATIIHEKVECAFTPHYSLTMSNPLSIFDWIAIVLVVVGGLNWGLVAALDFDLVATLFGDMTTLSRVVYGLVGLAAIYVAVISMKLARK